MYESINFNFTFICKNGMRYNAKLSCGSYWIETFEETGSCWRTFNSLEQAFQLLS